MDLIDRQHNHFEKISEKYFSSRKNKNHLLLKKLIWNFFFSKISVPSPEGSDSIRIIEPMCGYGEGRDIIREHLTKEIYYLGFDNSETLVSLIKKQDPDINIIHSNVINFELAENDTFDLMILIGGLHHVYHHVGPVLKKLSDALSPSGYFINFEPTQNCYITRKIREVLYKKVDFFDDQTEKAFDLEELNSIYYESNFKIIYQTYPGLLSYILYYNPDAFPILNIGPQSLVKYLFWLDKKISDTCIAKQCSFATLTLLQKI